MLCSADSVPACVAQQVVQYCCLKPVMFWRSRYPATFTSSSILPLLPSASIPPWCRMWLHPVRQLCAPTLSPTITYNVTCSLLSCTVRLLSANACSLDLCCHLHVPHLFTGVKRLCVCCCPQHPTDIHVLSSVICIHHPPLYCHKNVKADSNFLGLGSFII